MDRENVIEGIEAIREFFGFGLPSQTPVFEAYQRILTDAIVLLKEQEAKTGHWNGPECSCCHAILEKRCRFEYCPHCGTKMELDV